MGDYVTTWSVNGTIHRVKTDSSDSAMSQYIAVMDPNTRPDGLEYVKVLHAPTPATTRILASFVVESQAPVTTGGQRVSNAQAQVALKNAGMLAEVQAMISSLPTDDTNRIFWEKEAYFDRSSIAINTLYAALPSNAGKDQATRDAELDALFVAASAINP